MFKLLSEFRDGQSYNDLHRFTAHDAAVCSERFESLVAQHHFWVFNIHSEPRRTIRNVDDVFFSSQCLKHFLHNKAFLITFTCPVV